MYVQLWRYNASHFVAQSIVHALIMFAYRKNSLVVLAATREDSVRLKYSCKVK